MQIITKFLSPKDPQGGGQNSDKDRLPDKIEHIDSQNGELNDRGLPVDLHEGTSTSKEVSDEGDWGDCVMDTVDDSSNPNTWLPGE